jgi:hypothetical protein
MMAGKTTTALEDDGTRLRLVDRLGVTIVAFAPGEVIDHVVLSDDRTRMLILVMSQLPVEPITTDPPNGRVIAAFRYSRLVLVWLEGPERFAKKSFLEAENPPMNERQRWIRELRSISNDGRIASLELGQSEPGAEPGKMHYQPRTINLWEFDPFEEPSN